MCLAEVHCEQPQQVAANGKVVDDLAAKPLQILNYELIMTNMKDFNYNIIRELDENDDDLQFCETMKDGTQLLLPLSPDEVELSDLIKKYRNELSTEPNAVLSAINPCKSLIYTVFSFFILQVVTQSSHPFFLISLLLFLFCRSRTYLLTLFVPRMNPRPLATRKGVTSHAKNLINGRSTESMQTFPVDIIGHIER